MVPLMPVASLASQCAATASVLTRHEVHRATEVITASGVDA